MNNKLYDHQDDSSQQQNPRAKENEQKMQQLEDDYNIAKLTADLNQLTIHHKEHATSIRHLQKDIQTKVTQSQLSEIIALINGGIQTDPSIIKLLKTKEASGAQSEQSKVKMNSLQFSKKLNQISESLSVLMGSIRKLETKLTTVQSQLSSQFRQKHESHQIQIEQSRSQQIKESMQLQQKMQLISFQLGDKMRDIDTRVNWKLNQFKQKIDDKISQQFVLSYLQQTEKRVDQNMKEYQLKSDINPDRIEAIQKYIQENRIKAENGITRCQHQLQGIRKQIDHKLLKQSTFDQLKLTAQKRQAQFNANFNQVYQRVKHCETLQVDNDQHIQQLLKDSTFSLKQLTRINTVLVNLKIGQDFQRMLQEMNPAKVLQLQGRVDQVHDIQSNIFREIDHAKRQIQKVSAKSDIMGVMVPNKGRQKLKKQQIQQALGQFLNDHQFSQKLSNIDQQLNHYKLSVESVNLLTKQVARIQKESDTHRIHQNIRTLEEHFKKEILFIHNQLKDRHSRDSLFMQRPFSRASNNKNEVTPVGQASHNRTFSVKKVNKITSFSQSNLAVINNSANQLLDRKALKNGQ